MTALVTLLCLGLLDAARAQEPGGAQAKEVAARTQAILARLDRAIIMPFERDTPLEDVLNYITVATQSPDLPRGIPIYVNALALREAGETNRSKVQYAREGVPLKEALEQVLRQLLLDFTVEGGAAPD
jgi:hypothetical protein